MKENNKRITSKVSEFCLKWAGKFVCAALLSACTEIHAQWSYSVNANDTNTVTISSYQGSDAIIIVPTELSNLLVTGFGTGSPVFLSSHPASVTIQNTITSIGYSAFQNCTALTNVTIGDSVTNMAGNVFYGCSKLTNVKLPNELSSIASELFYGCTSLTNVTCGPKITSIGNSAFDHCSSMRNFVIPSGVTNVGSLAFELSGLSSVSIPASYTNIASNAFFYCPSLTNVTIANGVTSINSYAFEYCISLVSITIPASVSDMVNYAFDQCTNLTSIFFAGNAPAADSTTFYANTKVTAYYLPGTSGWNAFAAESGSRVALWNPQVQLHDGKFGVQNNQFGFNIAGTSNIPIVVEACSNLGTGWLPLQSVNLTNGLYYFSDPMWTNCSNRFYRIRSP